MYKFLVVVLVSSILLSGCRGGFTQNNAATTIQKFPTEIVEDVAKLQILDMSSVDNFQKYFEFTNAVNALIKVLNEKSDGIFNIPLIEATSESFEKMSHFVSVDRQR